MKTLIEKILNSHGVPTTIEIIKGKKNIIAWCELGINEQEVFKIDSDISRVYKFLGY